MTNKITRQQMAKELTKAGWKHQFGFIMEKKNYPFPSVESFFYRNSPVKSMFVWRDRNAQFMEKDINKAYRIMKEIE